MIGLLIVAMSKGFYRVKWSFFALIIICKKCSLLYNDNILLSFNLKGVVMIYVAAQYIYSILITMFANASFYWWLIIAFLFLIMEMGNPGLFFFLSFFFGGLVAALISYLTESLFVQICVFFSSTIVALSILRYWGIALAGKNRPHQQTNFYALKGKRAIVKQDISESRLGLVVIAGQVWAARTISSENIIRIGDIVEVIDVQGAHVVVKKI